METVTLYSTWPTLESAEAAARELLEQRLIACANIGPGARSLFRWDGQIQAEAEVLMFAKTTAERAGAAHKLLVRLHPYDVPCLTALPVLTACSSPGFLAWVSDETAPSP